MNFKSKNKIFLGVLVLALIIGGFFLFGKDSESEAVLKDRGTEEIELEEGEIEVLGEISCLPYNIAVEGQECVKSIMGEDGMIYALDSVKVGGLEAQLEEGTEVQAVGVFTPANTSVDEGSVFRYDGVLKLRILQGR